MGTGSKELAIPDNVLALVDENTISKDIVRTALNSVYNGAPAEEVATALVLCKQVFPWNPAGAFVAGYVAVFKPASSDRWTWCWTLDAWLDLAHHHPNFGGLSFGAPERDDKRGEIRYTATAFSKDGRPLAEGVVGRCKFKGRNRRGEEYEIEWAEEIARARAIRHACRIAYGLSLPPAPVEDEIEVIQGHVVAVAAEDSEGPRGEAEDASASADRVGEPKGEASPEPPAPEQPEEVVAEPSDGAGEEAAGAAEPAPSTEPPEDEGEARHELIVEIETLADRVFTGDKTRRSWFASKGAAAGYSELTTPQIEEILTELRKAEKQKRGS